MGISDRKQRQREHVRQNILDAALRIVKGDGWEALSIRSIAEAIEYSAPVIYCHFESKENLLREFYKMGFELMEKELSSVSAKFNTPDDKIYAVAIAYWDFAFENKHLYQLMFGVNVAFCYQSTTILEFKKGVIALFESLLVSALQKNENVDADASLKRSTLWCILHGLVSINITGKLIKEEGKMERVLDDAIKGFIRSLRKE